ncbi:MAG: protein kinase, partial [Chloroflexota bacterium]|nr:protein kinase [Chloroflexota bacterium]
MAQKQTLQISSFRVSEEVRRDEFSVTYRAIDANKQELALRTLNPDYADNPAQAQRFVSAGLAAIRLRHENILDVYEAGESNGYPYMALELVEGIPLVSLLIRRNKLLSAVEVSDIAQQIGAGLDYAHSQGIWHGDLNLRNVLVAADGRILVGDFGLGSFGQSTPSTNGNHEPPAELSVFTPPEKLQADRPADARSDIYALGVIIYAMLVGRLPFEAQDQHTLRQQILEQEPPAPESVNPMIPANVAGVIKSALAKNPQHRPATAGEFATALTRSMLWEADGEGMTALSLLAGDAIEASAQSSSPRAQRKRTPFVLLFAALALIALVVGGLWARPVIMSRLGLGDLAVSAPTADTLATPIELALMITPDAGPPGSVDAGAGSNMAAISATNLLSSTQNGEIVLADATATHTATAVAVAPVFTATVAPSATSAAPALEQAEVTLLTTATETPFPPTPTAIPSFPTETATTIANTATATASSTVNATPIDTATFVPTATDLTAPTATATMIDPVIDPATALPTATPTNTAPPTSTPVPTAAATDTSTPVPTATSIPSATPTLAPTATPTSTNTDVPAPTATATPVDTATLIPTDTETPTSLPTATDAPSPTATATDTVAPTAVPTATATDTPPVLATATTVNTVTLTVDTAPVVLNTPSVENAQVVTATVFVTPTTSILSTNTQTPANTATSLPTATPTPTETATLAPTATALPTGTNTPLP